MTTKKLKPCNARTGKFCAMWQEFTKDAMGIRRQSIGLGTSLVLAKNPKPHWFTIPVYRGITSGTALLNFCPWCGASLAVEELSTADKPVKKTVTKKTAKKAA